MKIQMKFMLLIIVSRTVIDIKRLYFFVHFYLKEVNETKYVSTRLHELFVR